MPKEQADPGGSLVPIPVATLQADTMTPVRLYLRTAPGTFVLYRSAHIPLKAKMLERLAERGVSTLYFRRQDSDAYYEYVERNLQRIVRTPDMSRREVGRVVYRTASWTVSDLFRQPRSGRLLSRARRLTKATVTALMDDPETLWDMTAIAGHDYRTYTHCVNVGIFLLGGARELLGIDRPGELENVGVGGVLHDIGKSQVPAEILKKPGKLTEEEFETVKRHPLSGLELARRHRALPRRTARVIRCHHERRDGTGYPDGVKSGRLDEVARLSTIIDVYDALTTDRPYSDARTPYRALSLMMEEMEGHFDRPLLRRFVNFLGTRQDPGRPLPDAPG